MNSWGKCAPTTSEFLWPCSMMRTTTKSSRTPSGTQTAPASLLRLIMSTLTFPASLLNQKSRHKASESWTSECWLLMLVRICVVKIVDWMCVCVCVLYSSVVVDLVSGEWAYTLSIKTYSDASFNTAVEDSTDLQLDERIWVKLETTGLDDGIVTVVTDSCWATNEESSSAVSRHDLITDGWDEHSSQRSNVLTFYTQ